MDKFKLDAVAERLARNPETQAGELDGIATELTSDEMRYLLNALAVAELELIGTGSKA